MLTFSKRIFSLLLIVFLFKNSVFGAAIQDVQKQAEDKNYGLAYSDEELKTIDVLLPGGLFSFNTKRVPNVEKLLKCNLLSRSQKNTFKPNELVIVRDIHVFQFYFPGPYYGVIVEQDEKYYKVQANNSVFLLKAEEIFKFNQQEENEFILGINKLQNLKAYNAINQIEWESLPNNIKTGEHYHSYISNLFGIFFDFNKNNKFNRRDLVGYEHDDKEFIGIIAFKLPDNKYIVQGPYQRLLILPAEKIGMLKVMKELSDYEKQEKTKALEEHLVTKNITDLITDDVFSSMSDIKNIIQTLPENEVGKIRLARALGPKLLKTNKRVFLELKDDNGYTPLLFAVYLNKPVFAKYLVELGADIAAKTKQEYGIKDLADAQMLEVIKTEDYQDYLKLLNQVLNQLRVKTLSI